MDQMPARDHVIPETLTRDVAHAKSRAVFERKTRRIGILLVLVAAALTVLAVGTSVPLTGFAALMTVFVGGAWLSYRLLLARWARFRKLPITNLNRM